MAPVNANTWPPLVSGTSFDDSGQHQLYGQEVLASALIEASADDAFFYPVEGTLTGFSSDGRRYQAGAEIADTSEASWYQEEPGEFRGDRAEFPRRGIVLLTDAGISILDLENNWRMWMIFVRGDSQAFTHNFLGSISGFTPAGVSYQNGRVTVDMTPDTGSAYKSNVTLVIDFTKDQIYMDRSEYLPPEFYYEPESRVLTVGEASEPWTPFLNLAPGNAPQEWWVEPSLPSGMRFDAETGEITGTPTETRDMAPYVVTALNPGGPGVFPIRLQVATSYTPFFVVDGRAAAQRKDRVFFLDDGDLTVKVWDGSEEQYPATIPTWSANPNPGVTATGIGISDTYLYVWGIDSEGMDDEGVGIPSHRLWRKPLSNGSATWEVVDVGPMSSVSWIQNTTTVLIGYNDDIHVLAYGRYCGKTSGNDWVGPILLNDEPTLAWAGPDKTIPYSYQTGLVSGDPIQSPRFTRWDGGDEIPAAFGEDAGRPHILLFPDPGLCWGGEGRSLYTYQNSTWGSLISLGSEDQITNGIALQNGDLMILTREGQVRYSDGNTWNPINADGAYLGRPVITFPNGASQNWEMPGSCLFQIKDGTVLQNSPHPLE